MAAYQKFQQFVEDLAHKVHHLGSDSLMVALANAANAPSLSADEVLADFTQIAYTNLSSRAITVSSSGQVTGTYTLTLNDLTLTASGGSVAAFRYVTVYNDTPTSPADPLICMFDYGVDLTLANGESLTIDFQSNGPTTGALFTLA